MLRERREAGAEERNGGAQRRGATEERSGGRSFNGGQKQVDKGGEWKIKYSYRSGQVSGELIRSPPLRPTTGQLNGGSTAMHGPSHVVWTL